VKKLPLKVSSPYALLLYKLLSTPALHGFKVNTCFHCFLKVYHFCITVLHISVLLGYDMLLYRMSFAHHTLTFKNNKNLVQLSYSSIYIVRTVSTKHKRCNSSSSTEIYRAKASCCRISLSHLLRESKELKCVGCKILSPLTSIINKSFN
jgi:hypothetical protein